MNSGSELQAELASYPLSGCSGPAGHQADQYGGVLVPMRLRTEQGVLSDGRDVSKRLSW
jgi:hypothetical protein